MLFSWGIKLDFVSNLWYGTSFWICLYIHRSKWVLHKIWYAHISCLLNPYGYGMNC